LPRGVIAPCRKSVRAFVDIVELVGDLRHVLRDVVDLLQAVLRVAHGHAVEVYFLGAEAGEHLLLQALDLQAAPLDAESEQFAGGSPE
jgi:hypothetical protein